MTVINATKLPKGTRFEADLCIVGAGAAGLALATRFQGGARRIVLLESGGFQADAATQDLYRGASVGMRHAELHTSRLRFFGGSTNHWTAHVRPLDPIDFAARSWVPDSGWPFERAELEPSYERARRFLDLAERSFDPDAWRRAARVPWKLESGQIETRVRQVVHERRRVLGGIYRADLVRAKNTYLVLNANVLRIELADGGRRVTGLRVGTLGGGRVFVHAHRYVLATGGIENARILLLSAIGSARDLVGRYYANHPEGTAGRFQAFDPEYLVYFSPRRHPRGISRAFLSPSAACQRAQKLQNSWIELLPISRAHAGAVGHGSPPSHALIQSQEIAQLATSPADRPVPDRRIHVIAEQSPNPESRVRLGEDRDAFGQRRVVLDWRIRARDSESVRRTMEVLAAEVGAAGLGRVRITFPADGYASLDPRGSHHHMGTTRMHADAAKGVVDPNCRVHGVSNLYVAGSSVFPTYGTANPTFTILALAFRLADHLESLPRES